MNIFGITVSRTSTIESRIAAAANSRPTFTELSFLLSDILGVDLAGKVEEAKLRMQEMVQAAKNLFAQAEQAGMDADARKDAEMARIKKEHADAIAAANATKDEGSQTLAVANKLGAILDKLA